MALEKKTVIQLVVLVMLGGVAAAYFLLPDSGALVDSVVGMFADKPAPAPEKKAPAIKRRGEGATEQGSAPAAAKPKPAAPAIPNAPVKGMVSGKAFSLDRAYVENGVLVLLSGKDPATAGISIHGLSKAWDVPAGKNVKVAADAKGGAAPSVRVSWKDDAAGAPQSRDFKDHYTLQLELGAESGGKIPGKVLLALPDDQKSNVAGTFDAEVRGFRIVNGKPDLSADSTDTLEYLALQELLKDDPARNIADVTFHDQRLAGASDAMSGYLEVRYRAGDSAPTTERYQFMKAQGEWKVRGQLKLTQIDEAHPLKAPGAKSSAADLCPYLAARRLEGEIAKKTPKKGIYDVGFASRTADKYKIGQCDVSYRLEGAADSTKVSYLMRNKAKGWEIERALRANEKINFDNGRIEVAKAAKKK